MAERGEEKLIEVARHIARTLGRTDTMADDILQTFSNFDGRFSREKLAAGRYSDGSVPKQHPIPPYSSSSNKTIYSLDRQISIYLSSDRSIWSDSADAAAFLTAVDDISAAANSRTSSPDDRPVPDRADTLLRRCMLRLEEEFRSMIENPFGASPDPFPTPDLDFDSDSDEDRIPVALPVTDYNFSIDALPPGTLSDLNEIAKRMAAGGFGGECAHAYSLARKDFLDESMCRLGFRLPADPLTEVEDEICRWVKAANVAFRILFPSERRLTRRVFSGLPSIADLSFAETCRGPAIQLLRFADSVSGEIRSPEMLFRVIDMYETLRDVLPDLKSLFSDRHSGFLFAETLVTWKKLGEAIRGIFIGFDNLIRRDPAEGEISGGGMHPITRYVMNYLRAVCDSRSTLEEVMAKDRMCVAGDGGPEKFSSPFAVHISWIMEMLQGNLEEKARVYRQTALSCIFLMNNGRYMTQKVSGSAELATILGEDWIRRQAARERRWASEYQKSTWSRVMTALKIDKANSPTTKVMRERIRVVDVYFEEIWKGQSGWVVVDERLRKELRATAAGIMLPAYRRFLEAYNEIVVEDKKNGDAFVRHSLRGVELHINELFEGAHS